MLWSETTAMEPLLPQRWEALEEQAVGVIRGAAALGAGLHPITRRGVAALLRNMNSYYSNLIEGHHTHPADIERALRNDYVDDPRRRALQHLNAAHVQTEQAMQQRLAAEPQLEVTNAEFLRWIHQQLYSRIPEELLLGRGAPRATGAVVGGTLREREVEVGRHWRRPGRRFPTFLTRFSQVYPPAGFGTVRQVVVAAAAHHRLAWIHPFLDGNGRVARLFTQAYLSRAGSDSGGLWSMARGMARRRDRYMEALAVADSPRSDDLDGRGNLSLHGLEQFCSFFLVTARDQIRFIADLLDLDGLLKRIATFVDHVGPGLGLRAGGEALAAGRAAARRDAAWGGRPHSRRSTTHRAQHGQPAGQTRPALLGNPQGPIAPGPARHRGGLLLPAPVPRGRGNRADGAGAAAVVRPSGLVEVSEQGVAVDAGVVAVGKGDADGVAAHRLRRRWPPNRRPPTAASRVRSWVHSSTQAAQGQLRRR